MAGLDPTRLARVVGSIPAGRWMSYGDVAYGCGATAEHARVLNQMFIRHKIAGAHRVLMSDGSVSRAALGDAAGVRQRLEAEGSSSTLVGRDRTLAYAGQLDRRVVSLAR